MDTGPGDTPGTPAGEDPCTSFVSGAAPREVGDTPGTPAGDCASAPLLLVVLEGDLLACFYGYFQGVLRWGVRAVVAGAEGAGGVVGEVEVDDIVIVVLAWDVQVATCSVGRLACGGIP